METSEPKKFVKIFCKAFLIFKKYFATTIQHLFPFLQKGFLNSQAVRIRVKTCLCSKTYYMAAKGKRDLTTL
jgi:hypothetical protein